MMTKAEALQMERIIAHIEGFRAEMSDLAKKRPNDAVNEFKIKLINEALSQATKELGQQHKSLITFDRFDIDSSPSNSDVMMILSQYIQALDIRRSENIEPMHGGRWFYRLIDATDRIFTSAPIGAKRKS